MASTTTLKDNNAYLQTLRGKSEAELLSILRAGTSASIQKVAQQAKTTREQAAQLVSALKSSKLRDPKVLEKIYSSFSSLLPYNAEQPLAVIEQEKYYVSFSPNTISRHILGRKSVPSLLKLEYTPVRSKLVTKQDSYPELQYAFEFGRLTYAPPTPYCEPVNTPFVVVVNIIDNSVWIVYDFTISDAGPASREDNVPESEENKAKYRVGELPEEDETPTKDTALFNEEIIIRNKPIAKTRDPRDRSFILPWGRFKNVKSVVGLAKLFNLSEWNPTAPKQVSLKLGANLYNLASYDVAYAPVSVEEYEKLLKPVPIAAPASA